MKIGFFTDGYFPEIDGVAYTIKLWRERLEENGHEVWIVYPDGDYTPDDHEIPVRSLPNPFYPGYRIPLTMRTSRLPQFDVIHCHGPGPLGLLGRYCAWKRGLPSVYTHHTPIEEYFQQSVHSETVAAGLKRLYVPLENRYLATFDVVTASTTRVDRAVEPIELPVGVDIDCFTPQPSDRSREQPLIGYSGRLSLEKNVNEVLRVARHFSDCEFLIVGEGPRREDLERRAPTNVTVRDFLPRAQLPAFYSSLDVFVTASTADTLGLATLEANACGTPVAAADVPPFTETIGPDNGVRFAYGDIEEMAAAIDRCLEKDWQPRRAVTHYAIEDTLEKLTSIYKRVTDGNPQLDPVGESIGNPGMTD